MALLRVMLRYGMLSHLRRCTHPKHSTHYAQLDNIGHDQVKGFGIEGVRLHFSQIGSGTGLPALNIARLALLRWRVYPSDHRILISVSKIQHVPVSRHV